MGYAGFFGYLLISIGPTLSVFTYCIAPKSFLVLLILASSFYWLVSLFLISAVFRAFAPLPPDATGAYIALILVAVAVQELARYGLWRFHHLSIRALQYVSGLEEHAGSSLSVADHISLSFTHGLAHSIVHALFFCVAWLPLSIGNGTVYIDGACPQMNFFLLTALCTLAIGATLTSLMVLSFDAWERGESKVKSVGIPCVVHGVVAALTLLNFAHSSSVAGHGCLVSIPLLFAVGGVMVVWAGRTWWVKTATMTMVQRRNSSVPSHGND